MDGGKQNGKMWMQIRVVRQTGLGQAGKMLLTHPLKTVFPVEDLSV